MAVPVHIYFKDFNPTQAGHCPDSKITTLGAVSSAIQNDISDGRAFFRFNQTKRCVFGFVYC